MSLDAFTQTGVLEPFCERELNLHLPALGAQSPGLAWFDAQPEVRLAGDGATLTVLGSNMAGLWFVLAPDGSVRLMDACEQDTAMATPMFDNVEQLVAELGRQNGRQLE